MKIALLAPFEERVPPRRYGGTEVVVYNLAAELDRMGHDVTVFASGDSKIAGRLVAVRPQPIGSGLRKRVREAMTYQGLAKVVEVLSKEKFDILHNHIGWQALVFRDMFKLPMLTTLHWVLDNDCERTMYGFYKQMPFVSISNSQRKPLPDLNYKATIYHGLQLKKFIFSPKPADYLAFLGRFSPVKGPVEAIKIAKKTGMRLIMAAKINDFERDFYEDKIKPLIDGDQIVYIGEVNHAEKVKLLGGAKALLSPLLWAEPFGLTNAEALACGTPVIGTRRGSLPEIIKDGQVGFLRDTVDEMANCVTLLGQINRFECREYAEARFSAERMAGDYLRVYARTITQYVTQQAKARIRVSSKLAA